MNHIIRMKGDSAFNRFSGSHGFSFDNARDLEDDYTDTYRDYSDAYCNVSSHLRLLHHIRLILLVIAALLLIGLIHKH